MAQVKKEDIKEYSTEELIEKIKDQRLRYRKAKFNHTVSPLDNPLLLREMRRDVARLLTELNQRNKDVTVKKVETSKPAETKKKVETEKKVEGVKTEKK